MSIATLKIINPLAKPCTTEFNVDASAIEEIICWYSSYAAGDPYRIYVNGTKQKLDRNGQIHGEVLT